MGKVLVIAEKPSVGRDIAKVLGCSSKGDGFLFSDSYVVSWAIGHLVALFDPEDYNDAHKRWNRRDLPIVPYEIKLKPVKETKKQLTVLKKLMNSKEIDSLICATDSGREGELIFRYIYSIVKCKKPFKRLWISSMTDKAIKAGFANLKDGIAYDNLYYSAKCRSEADWLVGINATRAYTIRYKALLSIGRVQTPTLAILVERQKEINSFVPKPYWEVRALFEEYQGTWFDAKSKETKIFEQPVAEELANKIKGKIGVLESIEKETKKQPPPLLYDLTELQRDCNKRFGYSAQKTLSVAQDLYEKRKLITYPRTDSRYLSEDLQPQLINIIEKLTAYEEFTKYILDLPKLPISKRIIDNSKVTDHHAIIPTGTTPNLKSLSADEYNVYNLIVRRFLSVFYPNYIYCITKFITVVENEKFMTKGTTIVQLGWMELYKTDKQEEEENEILPKLDKGAEVLTKDSQVLSKKTQPPKAYTEGTLLSAMENAGRFVEDEELKEKLKDAGLGTPATRAAIIEKLLQVGYVERKAKALVPTEKAMRLIEILPKELKSPETTGKWEKGLTSISKGGMDPAKFMGSISRYIDYIITESDKAAGSVEFPEEKKKAAKGKKKQQHIGVCPKCENGQVLENTKAFYCSGWNTGCKFTVWKNSLDKYGGQINIEFMQKLLKDKTITGLNLTLPQTGEKCKADLIFKSDLSGMVELVNLVRE